MNDSPIESSIDSGPKNDENNQNAVNRKSISIFSTNSGLPAISEKGESSAERSSKSDSISRQLNFDNDEIDKKKEPDRPRINLFSKLQSNDTNPKKANESTRSSDLSWKTKSTDVSNVDSINVPVEALTIAKTNSTSMKSTGSTLNEPKLCAELQTPVTKLSDGDLRQHSINLVPKQSNNNDDETPYKTFQMPQTSAMRRAQTTSQHRTLLSSASQPRKCRTDLENEFRSQKVLFTTPSAVSRPAMKVMNHLGLDDSLNCYKSSPMVNNLSPVREERNKENKFPKNATGADDLEQSTAKMDEKLNGADVNDARAPSVAGESQEKKEKIITINNKDFIIQNKIGHGGSSSVFLVEHKDTKLQCALKVRISNFPHVTLLLDWIHSLIDMHFFIVYSRLSIYAAIQH